MGLHILRRAPRPRPAAVPDAPAVPDTPRGDDPLSGTGILPAVMPLAGGLGFVMFMIVRPSPVYIAVGIIWMVVMVGGGAGMALRSRRVTAVKLQRRRRDHAVALVDTARDATARFDVAAADLARSNPPTAALLDVVRDRTRLWERTSADADLLFVRFGAADRAVALADSLDAAVVEPDADHELDPVAREERRRVLGTRWPVRDLPVVVDLRPLRLWQLVGDTHRVRALARAVVLQAVAWRSPADLKLVVVTSPARAAEWRWGAWLPHTRWTEGGASHVAPVVVGASDAAAALPEVLRARRQAGGRSHLLLVLDGVGPAARRSGAPRTATDPAVLALDDLVLDLARGGGGDGVTVVTVGRAALPVEPGGMVTAVDGDGRVAPSTTTDPGADPGTDRVTADAATLELADAVARAIAPFRLPGSDLGSVDAANDTPHLPALLGVERPQDLRPEHTWAPRPAAARLVTPIGTTDDGGTVELDLKETALGGIGPHGIVIGATGSGKSELLRTTLAGLALVHPPEELAFVLVDFKGGAAFAPLRDLPHVAGLITNLSGDAALVERARTALAAELGRRQELLADLGLNDMRAYAERRVEDPTMPAEPSLLVVIDEFAELVTEHPEMSALLAMTGRLGRSLGVHLLLSSQRMDGTAAKGLESHLSYRIALRTFTASDSQAVLGTKDAAELPPVPGIAILQHEGRRVRFQSAYVGAPAGQATSGPEMVTPVRATSADPTAPAGPAVRADADGPPPATVLDTVVEHYRDPARQARRVWVDPLPAAVPLAALLPDVAVGPRGVRARSGPGGGRRVLVGLLDRPERQRVEPAVVDLAGRDGAFAVVGAPRSGKSTALASLVLSAALTHGPDELVFYVADLGGGAALRQLAALPHVGDVVGREDPARLVAMVAQLAAMVDQREERGGEVASTPTVLVVDNVADLRRVDERIDGLLLDLARRGPGRGVHLVLSASRWMDLTAPVREHLTGRWELRLADPVDSMFGRKRGEAVAAGVPGRGRDPDGHLVQWALPVPASTPADDVPDLVARLAGHVAAAATAPGAPEVRMLPDVLDPERLAHLASEFPGRGLPLGIRELDHTPVRVDLVDDGPHLLVLGDGRSGRTSTLRHLLRGYAARPAEEIALYVVDTRLELLDAVDETRLAGYAASAPAARELTTEIAELVAAREPGRDVDRRALRSRSWWSGPQVVVVVDDTDLLLQGAGYGDGPLDPLAGVVRRGHDLGLHVVVAGRVKGVQRLLRDPVVGGLLVEGGPTLLLSGDPAEGVLVDGLRAQARPPGRGQFARPRHDPVVVQTPFVPPPPDPGPADADPADADTARPTTDTATSGRTP